MRDPWGDQNSDQPCRGSDCAFFTRTGITQLPTAQSVKYLPCIMSPRMTMVVAAAALALTACKKDAAPIKEVNVEEAVKLHATGSATFLDANTPEYREANGVVPGAVQLDSFNEYDVAKVLPADKDRPLIFYCSNKF